MSINGELLGRVGRVSFGGSVREVSLVYTPEAEVGDYVVVHVGLALSVIDEAEALRTFELFHELDRASEPAGSQ